MMKKRIDELATELKTYFSPGQVTDVYKICEGLSIDIVEANIESDAYLNCENGSSIIILKESLIESRKRFTIAHELGHFWIPWHSELMFGCNVEEIDIKNEYLPREKEANQFAAELLMPSETFHNAFKGHINYEETSRLSNVFNVSFHAALRRSLDFSSEDTAVICCINRDVKWIKTSIDFPYQIYRKRVCELSVAEEMFDTAVFNVKVVTEPGYIWFDDDVDCNIEEESIYFPQYCEAISIVRILE